MITENPNTEQSPLQWLVALFMLLTLILTGYAVVRRDRRDSIAQGGGPPEVEEAAQNPTVNDITVNPDAYIGNGFIIQGVVHEMYNPSAFAIRDVNSKNTGLQGSSDNTLLVIIRNPVPINVGAPDGSDLQMGDAIRVTGRLTRLTDVMKETDGTISFNPDSLNIPKETPVVIASDISNNYPVR